MTGFTDTFGGSAVAPAQPSYLALTVGASPTQLQWPLEASQTSNPVVATMIDVTASFGGSGITMPDARQGSTGVASVVTNVGALSTSIFDSAGNIIVTMSASQSYLVGLTDNTTAAGSWRTLQLAATTSAANASALAGYGLQAAAGKLQLNWSPSTFTSSRSIDATDRAALLEYTGAGNATVQLGLIGTLGQGFCVAVQNSSAAGIVQMSTSGGDLINGNTTITISPSGNTLFIAGANGWVALGFLVGTLPVAQGGTGASTPYQALLNLGGGTTGIQVFEAATVSAVLSILGISQSTFTESTVSVNQVLASTSSNTLFVCTAALSLTLPLTTGLTKGFVVAAYAQGGAVTWTPQATDSMNGQTAGTNYVIPQGGSVLFATDAAGKWWPFFLTAAAGGSSWVTAAGTGNAVTAAFSPPNTSLVDGLLVWIRAAAVNTSTSPTLNVDGLGARTITRNGGDALQVADIPAAGAELIFRYNAAGTRWELLNPASTPLAWGAAGGTVDVITVTCSNNFNVMRNGVLIGFRATGANTSTTPTLNVNASGAITITKNGGRPLNPGDIPGANAEVLCRFNTLTSTMEMISVIPRELQWVAGAGTADAITATYAPPVIALYDGLMLGFRATAANATTTPTFAPNGLTARTITKMGGVALAVGDIPGNFAEVLVRYNLANTRWELINPVIPVQTLSAGSSGYLKLFGGFILQWGTGTVTTGSGTINYPTAFPNNVFGVYPVITGGAGAGSLNALFTGTPGLSSCAVYTSAAATVAIQWFAIGN